jgi:Carboxylesterase family
VSVCPAGGNVIVVAVSYRLNVMGFLALKELSQYDPRGTSGNYGILVRCSHGLAFAWLVPNLHCGARVRISNKRCVGYS